MHIFWFPPDAQTRSWCSSEDLEFVLGPGIIKKMIESLLLRNIHFIIIELIDLTWSRGQYPWAMIGNLLKNESFKLLYGFNKTWTWSLLREWVPNLLRFEMKKALTKMLKKSTKVYLSSITVAIVFLNGPIFVMISQSWSEKTLFAILSSTRKQKSQEKSVCFRLVIKYNLLVLKINRPFIVKYSCLENKQL